MPENNHLQLRSGEHTKKKQQKFQVAQLKVRVKIESNMGYELFPYFVTSARRMWHFVTMSSSSSSLLLFLLQKNVLQPSNKTTAVSALHFSHIAPILAFFRVPGFRFPSYGPTPLKVHSAIYFCFFPLMSFVVFLTPCTRSMDRRLFVQLTQQKTECADGVMKRVGKFYRNHYFSDY